VIIAIFLNQIYQLPVSKRQRYQSELGLSAYDTRILADDRVLAEYFEAAIAAGGDSKQVTNWLIGDIAGYLKNNNQAISDIALKPEILAELVNLIDQGTISGKIAKEILPELLTEGGSAKALVEKKGLIQISDSGELEKIIDEVIASHPDELAKFRAGKTKLRGFFVGQVMKKTSGRADPKLTNQLLGQKLSE